MKNFYEILEISINSTQDEIKKAYRLKAIKYHPDKHLNDSYFTLKFIEVKEAYDVLSDIQKRKEYDLEFRAVYHKVESQNENKETKRKEKEKEEQFFYNPHVSFYSIQDRLFQDTPQVNPTLDHWGNTFIENADFFALPTRIGKIVSGYTNLTTKQKPFTKKEKNITSLKFILGAIITSAIVILIFRVQDPIWISVWCILPIGVALALVLSGFEFYYLCNYIGVNGFAEYKCNSKREILESYEINFNDVIDLISLLTVRRRNGQYSDTSFTFAWMLKDKTSKITEGSHRSKENNPEKSKTSFWLNTIAERYWTVYLLDKMESELEKKGYLEFNLYLWEGKYKGNFKYIQLGVGYITFLSSNENRTYQFNEIKKVYTKGTNLFIEHKNYQKKFFFFESGNKNGIPLMNLANRQFFLRAMELLLGYKFS